MTRLPWSALLDALEERTRRLAAVVDGGAAGQVLDPALVPDAPLPPELAPRVRALLAETLRLQAVAERRTAAASRALHYARPEPGPATGAGDSRHL